ncbi:hypothetical protein LINPERPRIM_LOCUS28980 [Linum perenne]
MACRAVLRSVFVTEPWRPLHQTRRLYSFPATTVEFSVSGLYSRSVRHRRRFHSGELNRLNCSSNGGVPEAEFEHEDQEPPQEAVLKAISEVSKTEGRVGQTTNVVIGGTVADDSTNEWLDLDKKVNTYPTVRGFTAIGTGGDDFVQAMVVAVESVIQQPIPQKTHSVIPAHLVAEAISTLRGLDLRWSGPITPTEMEYVKQYVLAKYPQYSNGIVEDGAAADNLEQPPSKTSSPQNSTSSTPSFSRSFSDLDRTQLEHSRLLDILTKKTSFQGNFMSIPEIQGRNRALRHCGLSENDYLVIFMPSYKDALTMVGESYPFFKGNYYMTIVGEKLDGGVRTMAAGKEAKVVPMPESWLDLRIKGSQLSQYFRRKCKSVPKGLFAYPAELNGIRYSMHWISEAHRNSWHVLLDATGVVLGEERMNLALHRPDFVVCGMENNGGSGHGFVDNGGQQMVSNIACLLVRKDSFDTS